VTQIHPVEKGLVRRQVVARVHVEHVALSFSDIERGLVEGVDKHRPDRRALGRSEKVPESLLAELGHEHRTVRANCDILQEEADWEFRHGGELGGDVLLIAGVAAVVLRSGADRGPRRRRVLAGCGAGRGQHRERDRIGGHQHRPAAAEGQAFPAARGGWLHR